MQLDGGRRDILSIFSRPSMFSHSARSAGGAEGTEDSDGSAFMGETVGTLQAEEASFDISGNEARLVRWSGEP